MILEINQTNSAGINMFEVVENGQLIYRAESPWYPMITDHTRKIKMFNPMGQQVFETYYSLLENITESAIPYKYLFTGAQKFNQYSVINSLGDTIGAFYKEANGLLDGKLVLQYREKGLTGYRRSIGPIEVVSFYEEDRVVAQLTKSNKTVNNLDKYLLHVIDGYDAWLPVMVFFVVYFDFIYHNNGGEVMIGTKIKYNYTFDANMDKYDPNFILQNFGQEEAERIAGKGANSIVPPTTVGGMSLKTFWIIFGSCWGVAILIAVIVLAVIFL